MTRPPTLNDLQGEWKIVSIGEDGGKAPFFLAWFANFRLSVEGNRYTKFMRDTAFESGKLRVRPAAGYSELDEKIVTGEDAGKVHLGIVRWVRKTKLEHLQGKPDGDRPSGFPYTRRSRVGYAVMKRG